MKQHNTTSNFTPAQTPQANEIQKVALWVAERIGTGTGMAAEDMILIRDTLLSLSGQVESVELTLMDALHKVLDLTAVKEQAEPLTIGKVVVMIQARGAA